MEKNQLLLKLLEVWARMFLQFERDNVGNFQSVDSAIIKLQKRFYKKVFIEALFYAVIKKIQVVLILLNSVYTSKPTFTFYFSHSLVLFWVSSNVQQHEEYLIENTLASK